MTNLYDKYILPKVTNALCASGPNMKQRQKLVPRASGTVLEVGVGSGLNFKFYDPERVERLYALDPSEQMWAIAQSNINRDQLAVEYVRGFAEQMPVDDHSMDCIVITYTLCTISDVASSMREMHRVLKPDGRLLFCEHGLAPDPEVQKWQRRLNPIWKRLGGGCQLIRDIPALIQEQYFSMAQMETMYIPGFRPACFNFWGTAVPKA